MKLRKKERAKVGRSDRWVFVCVVIQSSQCKKKQRGCRKFLHKIYLKKKKKKAKKETKKKQPSHRNAATHAKHKADVVHT